MDKGAGTTQDPFMLGTVAWGTYYIQFKASTCETITQVQGKDPKKLKESAMSFEINTILSERTVEPGQGNNGIFTCHEKMG